MTLTDDHNMYFRVVLRFHKWYTREFVFYPAQILDSAGINEEVAITVLSTVKQLKIPYEN